MSRYSFAEGNPGVLLPTISILGLSSHLNLLLRKGIANSRSHGILGTTREMRKVSSARFHFRLSWTVGVEFCN